MTSTDRLPQRVTVWPGDHQELGARYDGTGTNFAVWAPDATGVELCMFDDDVETRTPLPEHTLGVWHGFVPGVRPGQRYGFRAGGPWDPAQGHVFDPGKLLLDPYARAIDGEFVPDPAMASVDHERGIRGGDTARIRPRSVVVGDEPFDWGDDHRPDTPWRHTVIYEAHVKGLTYQHPDIPTGLRGTYAGLGHPAMIHYLKDLGVTAVELLPVHHFVSEPTLLERGLVNYWGYNSIGFFAPHAAYSASGTRGEQVTEFKQMVKDLHAAGLEVILDVVYNHTAEGGPGGPVLAFRGYDEGSYYRTDGWGRYADVTGCGNTVNVSEPQVLRLVMDSLRYWVVEMRVDGFRFDLAPALTRNGPRVDLHAPFLTAVHQDPALRRVKLIAEPWDATSEGYLVGRFPPPWCEWNDKYRDAIRDFWRGHGDGVRDLASRISGSSDLYADDGRLPFSSVNFVTAHDGFTLRDLVSYNSKHNEANGESDSDGTDNHRSWNCGAEGETTDPAVRSLRRRQAANLLATLLLSTGVPMITAGDERGRTQAGNNNAFCQDNETSWFPWERLDKDWQHLDRLTRLLLRLRADHPVLRQRHFFAGAPAGDSGRKDVTWLKADGSEMNFDDWQDPTCTTLGMFLAGDALRGVNAVGEQRRDTSYVLWLHAGAEPIEVTLPAALASEYVTVIRTDGDLDALDDVFGAGERIEPGTAVTLLDRTFAVFEAVISPR
jgi:glycogen debranching enzyme GlgX